MRITTIECENCHGNSVRLARYDGLGERVGAFFGIQPFRCRDCRHRFTVSIWLIDKLAYAKCPKCLRTDLVFWSKKYYRPNMLTNFLISLGARRYRCASCRCNFVSFRARLGVDPEATPQTPPEAAPEQAAQSGGGHDARSVVTASVLEVRSDCP